MTVELKDIGKKYGKNWIFRGVNHVFESGIIYPIIGHNGSGKSTLLQIIAGFVSPSIGTLTYKVNNAQLEKEKLYKQVSFAGPYTELFDEFSVSESLNLHHRLSPLHLSNEAIMEQLDLQTHRHKPLNQLSSGMKQRLKLAVAIYSRTSLLLLDEPTSNLDQRWSDWYNEVVLKYATNRITIICSNSREDELKHANGSAIRMQDFRI